MQLKRMNPWSIGGHLVEIKLFYMEFKKHICKQISMLLLSYFISLVGSPSVLIFGFDMFAMVYRKSEFLFMDELFSTNDKMRRTY